MDNLNTLPVIVRFVPTLPLEDALTFADELYRVSTNSRNERDMTNFDARKEIAERAIHATIWAEKNFNEFNRDHKIKSIKRLREQFPDLSLLEAKTIVDNISWRGLGIALDLYV